MDINEKVSIIVPIYMVEKYLDRCIKSLVMQTYSNIEIILVDDGSPDSCGEICDSYAANDSRIKVIHKKNGGLSDARNIGFSASTGDIISYVDSDDWISKDMIFETVRIMQQHKSDIVSFGFYRTDGYKLDTIYNSGSITVYNSDEALLKLCQNKKIQSHAWDKIYRRKVLENNPFPIGKLYEDIFVMHRIFDNAERVSFVDKPFYYYYQREGSILTTNSTNAFYDYIEGCERRTQDLLDKSNSICSLTRAMHLKAILDVLRIISRQNNDFFISEYRDLCKRIQKWENCVDELKHLSKTLQIEYSIIKLSEKLYRKYRYLVEITKCEIDKIVRKRIKSKLRKIKATFKKYKEFKTNTLIVFNHNKNCKRIILLGSPEYDNLGDHAIAYATRKFVEHNFPDYNFLEVSENYIDFSLPILKRWIRKTDLLLLQGGGNINEIYEDQQRIRRKIISSFPDNKIILMPQTCCFGENDKGIKELEKTKTLFNNHRNLVLFAREEYSFNVMSTIFRNKVCLTPDIVLSLCLDLQIIERNGVAVCLRSDKESNIDIAAKNWIIDFCMNRFHTVEQIDTCTKGKVTIDMREEMLLNFWKDLSEKKLLITDRLHGMVFAIITNTPCVVLSNFNYKIKGVYKWIKDVSWVSFCDNPYNIEQYIDQVLEGSRELVNLSDKYEILAAVMGK